MPWIRDAVSYTTPPLCVIQWVAVPSEHRVTGMYVCVYVCMCVGVCVCLCLWVWCDRVSFLSGCACLVSLEGSPYLPTEVEYMVLKNGTWGLKEGS